MSDLTLLEQHFRKACELAKTINSAPGPHRPGEALGSAIRKSLQLYSETLLEEANVRHPGRISIQISRGKGYMPRILWAAFTPKNRKVSNDMAVVTCFGKHGEGAVVGVMDSLSFPRRLAPPVKRTGTEDLHVDVNGGKSSNNYNDRFVNPREFLADDLELQDLVRHARESINLLRKLRPD